MRQSVPIRWVASVISSVILPGDPFSRTNEKIQFTKRTPTMASRAQCHQRSRFFGVAPGRGFGAPQCGQLAASVETWPWHSRQETRLISVSSFAPFGGQNCSTGVEHYGIGTPKPPVPTHGTIRRIEDTTHPRAVSQEVVPDRLPSVSPVSRRENVRVPRKRNPRRPPSLRGSHAIGPARIFRDGAPFPACARGTGLSPIRASPRDRGAVFR